MVLVAQRDTASTTTTRLMIDYGLSHIWLEPHQVDRLNPAYKQHYRLGMVTMRTLPPEAMAREVTA
jgi:hypothetical protein